MCLFFHKWSKWEQYTDDGHMLLSGILVNKESRGKVLSYSHKRQKRACVECGKVQDELVSEDDKF
jgi:hypothetical protein